MPSVSGLSFQCYGMLARESRPMVELLAVLNGILVQLLGDFTKGKYKGFNRYRIVNDSV